MPASRSQRRLAAQVAAHTRWSRQDGVEGTAAARAAFLDRFERQVDPDGVLAPAERARRAVSARKAYFARLALKSAQARARRRAASSGESETAA
jgi:hypothetical protein